MTVLQAILPVLGLLAGGACVGAFAYFGKRNHEKDGLPTDPLTELFVNDDGYATLPALKISFIVETESKFSKY